VVDINDIPQTKCPECGGMWSIADDFCIECGFDGTYDDEYNPDDVDAWQADYEHWLEGGEVKGDQDRDDGIDRRWLPIQDDEEVANE